MEENIYKRKIIEEIVKYLESKEYAGHKTLFDRIKSYFGA